MTVVSSVARRGPRAQRDPYRGDALTWVRGASDESVVYRVDLSDMLEPNETFSSVSSQNVNGVTISDLGLTPEGSLSVRVTAGAGSMTAMTVTTVAPVTSDDAFEAINDLKAKYNAHIADLTYHLAYNPLGGQAVSSADATDIASAITLADEIKAKFGIHIAATSSHQIADTLNAVTVAAAAGATTLAPIIDLLKDEMEMYLAHTGDEAYGYHTSAPDSDHGAAALNGRILSVDLAWRAGWRHAGNFDTYR